MTQAQLNRAVARATGDECEVIAHRGFSLVTDEEPAEEDDLLAMMTDWQQLPSGSVSLTPGGAALASVA